MATFARLHIKKLPENVYLATSEDIPGLVAQGKTLRETIEIARSIAIEITESRNLKGVKGKDLSIKGKRALTRKVQNKGR